MNTCPKFAELRLYPYGYTYWTSGRYYNDSSNYGDRRMNWKWSRTNVHGERLFNPDDLDVPILCDRFCDSHVTDGLNSSGTCLLFKHGEYAGLFSITPNFCTNPYRFICEREFL